MGYLRPRNIFDKFYVAQKVTKVDSRGRQTVDFKQTGKEIFGVLTSAEPHEVERLKSLNHEVTHTLIQKCGRVEAKVGDLLISRDKKYLVQLVDNPANLGQWLVYYLKGRNDL